MNQMEKVSSTLDVNIEILYYILICSEIQTFVLLFKKFFMIILDGPKRIVKQTKCRGPLQRDHLKSFLKEMPIHTPQEKTP